MTVPVTLRRIVARIDLKLSVAAALAGRITLSSAQVVSAPNTGLYFCGQRASVGRQADKLPENRPLRAVLTRSFYLLENLRGKSAVHHIADSARSDESTGAGDLYSYRGTGIRQKTGLLRLSGREHDRRFQCPPKQAIYPERRRIGREYHRHPRIVGGTATGRGRCALRSEPNAVHDARARNAEQCRRNLPTEIPALRGIGNALKSTDSLTRRIRRFRLRR